MPYYRRIGEVPHKRHVQFRQSDGTLYAEEGIGIEGFGSDWALLYHKYLPTGVISADAVDVEAQPLSPNHPLKNRHIKAHDLKAGGDLLGGRQLLFGNDDVLLSYVISDEETPLFRNAIGDELYYIEEGEGLVETTFGRLEVRSGDYVVMPVATTQRWLPRGPMRVLVVEARGGHIGPPARYLTKRGQFTEESPYCERDLRPPDGPLVVEGEGVEVFVKNRNGLTRFVYERHPFDVVGWDGCHYPYTFNVADFEPITGRVHQPPPQHQVFEGPNFVVCNFVPRKVDYHPAAIPVPYNHSNVDSDEVLFYVGGDYAARKGSGIGLGSMSLHPSGVSHGPQPGAPEAAIGKEFADETAVMVDTFRPLLLGPAALAVEDTEYAWSWTRRLASEGGD